MHSISSTARFFAVDLSPLRTADSSEKIAVSGPGFDHNHNRIKAFKPELKAPQFFASVHGGPGILPGKKARSGNRHRKPTVWNGRCVVGQ